jgi:hypothetical protein
MAKNDSSAPKRLHGKKKDDAPQFQNGRTFLLNS